MGTTVTHSFSAGGTIAASQHNTNNSDLAAAIDQKAPSTGITAKMLSDRFSRSEETIVIVPPQGGSSTLVASAEVIFPVSPTTIFKRYHTAKSGQEAYLCEIEVYVLALTAGTGGASYPRLSFYVNTTLIWTVDLKADDTTYKAANDNPLAAPLFALANGDQIKIDAACAADDPTEDGKARGVYVTFVFKSELSS
ncbi:MAG TPA: hypothetical protein VD948_02800 [Rhodothermales bacterium]|nr:hypothetical protein [Rhodothermales bacterium]